MARVKEGLIRSVLDLRVASLAFVLAFLFAAIPPPSANAFSGVLDCDPCESCSPGTTPLPDEDCGHCSGDPPSSNYEYCSCCEGEDGDPHCCWDIVH